MGGYAGQVIRLKFDNLSEDPATDPIWVVIKNPKLQPMQALQPSNAAAYELADGEDREAAAKDGRNPRMRDPEAASQAGREVAARLVIAWRVYDATTSPQFDPLTGEPMPGTGQSLLPPPSGGNGVSADLFGKLPMEIQTKVMNEIAEAVNPQSGQGAAIQKKSSGQPSPSSTEPGTEMAPLPS